jgi:HAD superfamily hydrolase (TIGR01458 family)
VTPLAPIRALLLDLEGTVYQNGRPIRGAPEALQTAARRGVPFVFVTNTTSRPRSVLARELDAMGLPGDVSRIFTAPRAARQHLLAKGIRRAHLLLRESLREDFDGIEAADSGAEAVVLGDLGEAWTFERLNRAFRLLLEGAELVALARNRYWRGPDGLMLDTGPFVAALEHASGTRATLVGKPSPEFFAAAIASLGVAAADAACAGDDLESDVGGAQAAGLRGILVKTGKFRPSDLERSRVTPDAILDSIADLPELL